MRQRAEVDDGDFPAISHRLHQYTAANLVDKAKWHSFCYKDTVNSSKTEHALKAYQQKLAASAVTAENANSGCDESTGTQRPCRQSACHQLQGNQCLFCGDDDSRYALQEVSSSNVGRQIRQVVEASSNEEWKAKLQPDDARSIDVKYHLKCYVKYVQRSGPSETVTTSNDEHARAVCANMEFVAILRTMR